MLTIVCCEVFTKSLSLWYIKLLIKTYNVMRDLLEKELVESLVVYGDTTVLASLLERLSDEEVYNALGDDTQVKLKFFEIGIVGKHGFSTSVISTENLDAELDEYELINLAYKQGKLEGDDGHYVGYIEELTYKEWVERFGSY